MLKNILTRFVSFRIFGRTKDEVEGRLLVDDTSGVGAIVKFSDTRRKARSNADMSIL